MTDGATPARPSRPPGRDGGPAARRRRLGLLGAVAVAGTGLVLALATPAQAARGGPRALGARGPVAAGARGQPGSAAPGRAVAAPPGVLRVPVTGVIDPFLAGAVRHAVQRAGREGDGLVVLELDTPGGLDSSMREIVQAILDAPVPVVGYVTPRGAQAASAGTFIIAATSWAAMAPDTEIGAAHPVGISGQVLAEKVTNDAAAYVKGLAQNHRQSGPAVAAWYEDAVRHSVSLTATEAAAQGVVDDVYVNEAALLDALDGKTLKFGAGRSATVHTLGAPVRTAGLGPAMLLLHRLVDPNIAFLLFLLGVAGIVYEVVHPGIGVGGVGGALALIVALLEFQALPVELGGLVLIALGIALFVLDLKLAGHAFLSVFGVISLVLGGLLLYEPGSSARVHPVVLVLVVACVAALFLVVARKVLAARRERPVTGVDALLGVPGTVVAELAPEGRIRAAGIEWRARAAPGGTLPAGTQVVVTGLDGLTLEVERAPAPELGSPFPAAPTAPATPATRGRRRRPR